MFFVVFGVLHDKFSKKKKKPYLIAATECGANFTNNLEGMFRDMRISSEETAAFHKVQPAHVNLDDITDHFRPCAPEISRLRWI